MTELAERSRAEPTDGRELLKPDRRPRTCRNGTEKLPRDTEQTHREDDGSEQLGAVRQVRPVHLQLHLLGYLEVLGFCAGSLGFVNIVQFIIFFFKGSGGRSNAALLRVKTVLKSDLYAVYFGHVGLTCRLCLVQLAGTGVLSVGLWLRFDSRTAGLFEVEDSPTVFFTGVYVLIAAGALMMIVGFLGCCGAIKESPCMLGLFFFFLLIIFAAEVAAGIWGLSNRDKVIEDVTEFYKQTYNNYKDTRQEALKETLRVIHFGLNCCGPTGTVIDAAKDICPKKEGLEILITTSCPAAIDEIFNNKLHIIGGVGIGIGVIVIFGMIFSMMLCCAIKRSRDYV
ncbi:hypothetical protein L3Q82_009295 [Scortum barcoo]|uniref:Uncharacterized protein n=1 Tax=Scortum barcoo TaxID=214431 RepID=A0ACB8WH58_9TELE|nr:hypothetical protein L3Q82_009295 [Scortum barcoo]